VWPAKHSAVSETRLGSSVGWVTELSQRVKAGKMCDAAVFWKRVRFWSRALCVELNVFSETSVEMWLLPSAGIVSQSPAYSSFRCCNQQVVPAACDIGKRGLLCSLCQ